VWKVWCFVKNFENEIVCGDSLEILKTLPGKIIQCCVTSPPYWGLRDYGVDDQLGMEDTPEEYVSKMVDVFREVRRVLRVDGTLWLNLGDSYASKQTGKIEGIKTKDLVGIPWMVAFALRSDGWYLRQDIIWSKPNPMPESVTDRCTKSHEYIFLLSKSQKYYYDQDAIKEDSVDSESYTGRRKRSKLKHMILNPKECSMQADKAAGKTYEKRNKRSVWVVSTQPYSEAHFATYPETLIKPCILAGSKERDIILDPFIGSGTTALVSQNLNRKYLGIELNPESIKLCGKRLQQTRLEI